MKVYHGSNILFKKFDQNKARLVNNFYGGGLAYFTDDQDDEKSIKIENREIIHGVLV